MDVPLIARSAMALISQLMLACDERQAIALRDELLRRRLDPVQRRLVEARVRVVQEARPC